MLRTIILLIILHCLSLNLFSQAPDWTWADVFTDWTDTRVFCVTTDNSGNSIVGAKYHYGIEIDDTLYISQGESDILIVKYNYDGNIVWSRSFGGDGMDMIYDIHAGINGDIFISGFFMSSTIAFDTIVLNNQNYWPSRDAFILQLDSSGNALYAESFGGKGNYDNATSIISDISGNYYVAAYCNSDTIYIQDTMLLNSNPGGPTQDIIVAKFNPYHDMEWVIKSEGGNFNYSYDLALSPQGDLYVLGDFMFGPIVFDTFQINPYNYHGLFLLKMDQEGEILFAKNIAYFEGFEMTRRCEMSTDLEGNIIVGGAFEGTQYIVSNDTIFNEDENQNIFISRYDSDGNPQWVRGLVEDRWGRCNDIITDKCGNIYTLGNLSGNSIYGDTIHFSDTVYMIIYGSSLYITKYTPDGHALWALTNSTQTDGIVEGEGIAIDSGGNLYVSGWYSGNNITFGSQTYYTSATSMDAFHTKLEQDIECSIETSVYYPQACSNPISIPIKTNYLLNVSESNLQLCYDDSMFSYTGFENFNPKIQADSIIAVELDGTIDLFWSTSTPTCITTDTLVEFVFNPISTNDSIFIVEFIDSASYHVDSSGLSLESIFFVGEVGLNPSPGTPYFVLGVDSICQGSNTIEYGIGSAFEVNSYSWSINPDTAGVINGNDTLATVYYSPDFSGTAYIEVCGVNDCGPGELSVFETDVLGSPVANAGLSANFCENSSHQLQGSATNYSNSVWITSGDGGFDDPFKLDAIYTPGPEDIINGDAYLTLYAIPLAPCSDIDSETILLTFYRLPGIPEMPEGPEYIIPDTSIYSEYTTSIVANAEYYKWHLDPIDAGNISGNDTMAIVQWNPNFPSSQALISVEAFNDCGGVSSDTLEVFLSPVGLTDYPKIMTISVSPNPSDGIFSITLDTFQSKSKMVVYNSFGTFVENKILNITGGTISFDLNLSNQSAGVYYLVVISEAGKVCTRALVKR